MIDVITNEIIVDKIKKLNTIKESEKLKYEMYSIFTNIILSKDELKSNKDLMIFLKYFDIGFRDYVFKSRTLTLARTLRIIEKSELDLLKKYSYILNEKVQEKISKETSDIQKEKSKKQNEKNKKDDNNEYISNILNKYSRNKR